MIECTNGFKPLNCQCVQRNSLASLEAKKKPKNCSPAANEVEENKSENTEEQSGMGAPTPVTMRKQQMVPPRNQGCH